MPTRVSDGPRDGLGAAAKQVAERAGAIVRLELELAALEIKRKLARLALGIGLAVGGLLFLLFGLGFGLAAIAAGLATAMPVWAALLVVFGALVVGAGLLVFFGVSALRRGAPVPEQAIEEAKRTSEALRRNGR